MEVIRIYKFDRDEFDKRAREKTLMEFNKAVKEQEDRVEESRRMFQALEASAKKNIETQGTETLLNLVHSQEYIDERKDFESGMAFLEMLKLKQVNETIRAKMHADSVVIHEEAVISDTPVSPDLTSILIYGAILGFLLSPLMFLMVIRILGYRTPEVAL